MNMRTLPNIPSIFRRVLAIACFAKTFHLLIAIVVVNFDYEKCLINFDYEKFGNSGLCRFVLIRGKLL